jgi:hypothetical protein
VSHYTLTVKYDPEKDPQHAITQRLMEMMYEVSGLDGVHEVKLTPSPPGERVTTVDVVPGVEQGSEATR